MRGRMEVNTFFSKKWHEYSDTDGSSVYALTSFAQYSDDPQIDVPSSLEKLEEFIPDLSTCIVSGHKVLATTDRYGTAPIFYAHRENIIYVTDKLKWLVETLSPELAKEQLFEQIAFDMIVSPQKTMYKDVFRVPAGVRFDILKQKVIEKLPAYHPVAMKNWDEFYDQLPVVTESLLNSFSNNVKYYIPLSGGIDSRLVLAAALKTNPKEIYSRTFGSSNSLDVKYGRKVAQKAGVNHKFVNKSDAEAIKEFEQMVEESAGSVSGVHGHDLKGRVLLEDNFDVKVSGFIGDVFARGSNMKDSATVHTLIEKVQETILGAGYETLIRLITVKQVKTDFDNVVNRAIQSFLNRVEDVSYWKWEFYEFIRIPNLISLLEYQTHEEKFNLKPFLIPIIRNFISSSAGLNRWPGEAYFKFAQSINPKLFDIPLSSNSIFASKGDETLFRAKRRLNKEKRIRLAKWTKGKIDIGSYNHTLNWSRIIRENRTWALSNLKVASEFLDFDYQKVLKVYDEHCNGKMMNETILIRLISIGITIKLRYD